MKGEGAHGGFYSSVSEQKMWSDGSRQPIGCGRRAAEWEERGERGGGDYSGWGWCV